MDIVSALAVLSPYPVEMHPAHLVYSGTYHPLIVSCAELTPAQRQVHLSKGSSSDPDAAILLALLADDSELAWSLLNDKSLRYAPAAELDLRLKWWVAEQLAALNLPATGAHLHVRNTEKKNPHSVRKIHLAEQSIQEMFSSLPWPLWSGPLLIQKIDAKKPETIQTRPVFPIINLNDAHWNELDAGAAIAELVLQRYRQGGAPWPQWLIVGMREVAKHKVDGSGPSPRRMLKIRQKAGADAAHQLWKHKRSSDSIFTEQDTDLAKAYCAVLMHTRHKHKLASFLALLSNQIDPALAFQISYERSMDSLIEKP